MAESDLVPKSTRTRTLAANSRLLRARSMWERDNKSLYRELRSRIGSIVKSTIRNRGLFAVDITLSAFALILAAGLRFGPQKFIDDSGALETLIVLTGVFAAICAVTFPTAGLYKRKWRYASIPDY